MYAVKQSYMRFETPAAYSDSSDEYVELQSFGRNEVPIAGYIYRPFVGDCDIHSDIDCSGSQSQHIRPNRGVLCRSRSTRCEGEQQSYK